MTHLRRALDWLYTPQWAGGWWLARWLWVLAATLQYGLDVLSIPDVWGADDMLFASGPYRLVEWFHMTPTMAYVIWCLTMAGIGMVAWGGRLLRPGLLLWAVAAWTFLGYEALTVKAHDRLLLWVSIGLFLSPAHERDLHLKWRSPASRWYMMVVFASIYGGTGFNKALAEPTWWTTGEVLGYHFLDPFYGSKPLGVWLSGQAWALPIMSITTVVWESAFPFLIWFKRLTPPLLLIGMCFHVMLLLTMNVGPFAFVSLAGYPVLLHPELAHRAWRWMQARWSGGSATGQG